MHIRDYLAFGLCPSSSDPKGTGSNIPFRKLDRFPKDDFFLGQYT